MDVLDFSHFKNPAFCVFALSNFLLYMWYDVPYVYIADNGMSMGFNESQSSMLISIIGIVNMFGEVSVISWIIFGNMYTEPSTYLCVCCHTIRK